AFLRIDANRTDQPARCGGGGKCPPQIARRNQNGRTTNKDESCLLESVVFDPRPQNRCPPRALLANSHPAGPSTILSLKSAHGELASDAVADRERLTHEMADSVICLRVRRKHQWFDLGDFK